MELYAALYRHTFDKNFSLSLDLEVPPKTMWVVSNIDKHFSRQALFEFLTLKNKKWSVSFLLYAYGIGLTCHRRYFTSRSKRSTLTRVGGIVLLCNTPAIPGICVKPEHFTNPNHAGPASHLAPFYPLGYDVRYSTTMLNISSLLKEPVELISVLVSSTQVYL